MIFFLNNLYLKENYLYLFEIRLYQIHDGRRSLCLKLRDKKVENYAMQNRIF